MAANSFPEFITSRRRELELTLGDVATSLSVSPITVSNWSNGQSRPNPENLVALANLLEVPSNELADMAGVTIRPEAEARTEEETVGDDPTDESDLTGPETDEASNDAGDELADTEAVTETPDSLDLADAGTREIPVAAADSNLLMSEDVEPDAIDSELAELIQETSPDNVPALVTEPAAPPEPAPAPSRRPPRRPPSDPPAVAERPVSALPITYIEDPRQLMRYRIRWGLTVAVLAVMFIIFLWATSELISALSDVRESVTPGGLGS